MSDTRTSQPQDLRSARNYLDEAKAGPEGIWDSITIKILTARAGSFADAREIGPSLKIIEMARDGARNHSFPDLEFAYRLAAARLEFKSGNASAARREITELEHDASARGFFLFARRAKEAGRMHDRR